jgi:hypothetical protein
LHSVHHFSKGICLITFPFKVSKFSMTNGISVSINLIDFVASSFFRKIIRETSKY